VRYGRREHPTLSRRVQMQSNGSTEEEVWKDVPGYGGLYLVSSLGRVMSKRRVILRKTKHGTCGKTVGGKMMVPCGRGNYLSVVFCKNGRQKNFNIHRMVAIAFIGQPRAGYQCCHNDGDRQNNCLSNLRWDTPKNNTADKMAHGTHQCGEKSGTSKLSENDVVSILSSQLPVKDIALALGVCPGTIYAVKSRSTWRHIQA
jgi:hypothetical protein